MIKKNKILIRWIYLICISLLLIIIALNHAKKVELKAVKEKTEPLLLEYYSLLDEKKWSQAKELIFVKEENSWILNELEYIWEDIDILDKEIIKFKKITTNLYATEISLEIYSEEADKPQIEFVHPYIALIDSEFKIITHQRDIPEQFGFKYTSDTILFSID